MLQQMNGRCETLLAGNEAYELRNTLLNRFLRVLSYLGVGRKSFFHDSADVRNWQKPVLFTDVAAPFISRVVGRRRAHIGEIPRSPGVSLHSVPCITYKATANSYS